MALDTTVFDAALDSDGSPGSGDGVDRAFIEDVVIIPVNAEIARLDADIAAGGLSAGSNYINDTANVNMTVGLTINQGANDDQIVALKSSDVAHAFTSDAESDSFAIFLKYGATTGGLNITGLSENIVGLYLRGAGSAAESTRSTSALAPVVITAVKDTTNTYSSPNADTNLLVVQQHQTTRFILDADGDSHQDVGTAWTNFDTDDDVAVLNLLAAYVTRPDDPLRATFGQWLLRSRASLERLQLVTFNDGPDQDGHAFVNMSRLTMLLVGAARQLGSRVDQLERRLLALEGAHG